MRNKANQLARNSPILKAQMRQPSWKSEYRRGHTIQALPENSLARPGDSHLYRSKTFNLASTSHHHHSTYPLFFLGRTTMMSKRITRSDTNNQQQLSNAMPDSSKPPADGTCHWWDLDAVHRLKVLRLAYGRDRHAPMKPIMGVDFLRDEIGFVTTDRRRGKLPKLVSVDVVDHDAFTSQVIIRIFLQWRWQHITVPPLCTQTPIDKRNTHQSTCN